MVTHNITKEKIELMRTTADADDASGCFMGCVLTKNNLVRFFKNRLFENVLNMLSQ